MIATSLALGALALALASGVLVAAFAAATARSLVSLCLSLIVAGALAATALVAQGAGDAGLAQALFGVVIAPGVLLACLLLSTRSAKPRQSGRPWLTLIAALAAAGAMAWVVPDIGVAAPPIAASASAATMLFWLGALLFVAILAIAALLGYGERGAFQRSQGRGE